MVEFNHVLLLYQGIFHCSVLQVVQASTVLRAKMITNITDRHGWLHSITYFPVIFEYFSLFYGTSYAG